MNSNQGPLILKGTNKTLYLEGQMLRFKFGAKDLFFGSKEMRGSKEIHLSDVTSVQHKKADITGFGFIEFTLDGSQDAVSGRYGAMQDENTIVYLSPFKNTLAEEIVAYFGNYKNASHSRRFNNANYEGPANNVDNHQPRAEESTLKQEAAALEFNKHDSGRTKQIDAIKKAFNEGDIDEESFINMLKNFTD